MYTITAYSKEQAKKLGVKIAPSESKGKKIDVFKGGKKVASIGAIGYSDFPTYAKEKGLAYAKQRRTAYKQRHAKDLKVKDSPGYYANKILW
jgi:hypothetical protein